MDNISRFKVALKDTWKDRKVFWDYFPEKKRFWKFPRYLFGGALYEYEQVMGYLDETSEDKWRTDAYIEGKDEKR